MTIEQILAWWQNILFRDYLGFAEGVLFRSRNISGTASLTKRCDIISDLLDFSFTSSASEPKTITNIKMGENSMEACH